MSNPRWVIGLSLGTMSEGIEASLIEVEGIGLHLKARLHHTYRRPLGRELVESISRSLPPNVTISTNTIASVHFQIGEQLVQAAHQMVQQIRMDIDRVLAIGVLNPLFWHEPAGRQPSSYTIGMNSILADRLGVTVIDGFREIDVSAGGQGIPLSAVADALLFCDGLQDRLLLHLGSVASVVFLPAGGKVQEVRAFEIGPCNQLLNEVIRQGTSGKERYDAGGKYAVQGKCLEPLVDEWLRHPFFQKRPPRSLPRSEFGHDFIIKAVKETARLDGTLQDLLCSLSHFIIRAIVLSCQERIPQVISNRPVWISGGGMRNGLLWRLLEHYYPAWELRRFDDLGIPATSRSAVAAGLLAALTLDGVSASTPSSTGAVGRMLGRLTPGHPRNWYRCLRWMNEQSGEVSPYRAA